uniref:Uncharacterized protein n=1 Tax=Rhizophora mucronata TaxID=61149 RepID=A0A2P2PAP1_RHIMU
MEYLPSFLNSIQFTPNHEYKERKGREDN